ncbi:TPA: DUF2726 domain-containing protein [Escherichia coli]|nr:DUF2726 domain-containing protein [Escherichia coli]
MSKRERIFSRLHKKIKPEFYLMAQVRVADIIKPSKKYPYKSKEYIALFRQISQWHVDYIILSNEFNIICAIELDDKTHEQPKRKERDEIINEAFRQSGVPLLRINDFSDIEKNSIANNCLKN